MGLLNKRARTDGVSDPTKLLVIDHQKVERLFESIVSSESVDEQRGLVAQLALELERHTTLEEQLVYPFIRDNVEGGAEMIERAEADHAEAKAALAAFESSDPSAADFGERLRTVKTLVSAHVKDEEKHVLPKLDDGVDAKLLNALRGDMERAKAALHPTPDLPADTGTTSTAPSTTRGRPSRRKASSPTGPKRHVWVQPHHIDDSRWQVRREGATRASRVFDRQAEAEEFGRGVARREGVELILAGRDGSVREKTSYGNDDPRRPG
jgi:hemerythrin superfamily protein